MKRSFFVLVTLSVCLLTNRGAAGAQTQADAEDPPKFEAGVLFSTLSPTQGSRAGVGGRITYNLTPNVALEAETTFFSNSDGRLFSDFSNFGRRDGRAVQGLFGVKAGKRWEKFGVFAKARPGLITFSRGRSIPDPVQSTPPFSVVFKEERATHFAADVGGVLELYVSRRIVTRFDVGDTIIRDGGRAPVTLFTPPITFIYSESTRHNLQVSASVGYRFD